MKLSTDPDMRHTAHGSGAKGMAFYSYEDAAGLGVMLDVRRASSRHPFVKTFRFRWLPGMEFNSYANLRVAVESLTDEEVAAEKARWPQLADGGARLRDPRGTAGSCWLHQGVPGTHRATVQLSWHKFDVQMAILCEDCAREAATDAGVIVRASDARKAYCASLPPPLERLKGDSHG